MAFINDDLFPGPEKTFPSPANRATADRVVRDVFEDAYNYMKSGQLMRQVVNKISEVRFQRPVRASALRRHLRTNPQRPAIGGQRRGILHAPRGHRLYGADDRTRNRGETLFDPACGTGGFLTCSLPSHARSLRQEAGRRSHLAGGAACGGKEATAAHALL